MWELHSYIEHVLKIINRGCYKVYITKNIVT